MAFAFKKWKIVLWKLRNRWNNFLYLTRQINFIYTHIYREGNTCANKYVGHGTNTSDFVRWDLPPNFFVEDFSRNMLGLPSYRFCWFLSRDSVFRCLMDWVFLWYSIFSVLQIIVNNFGANLVGMEVIIVMFLLVIIDILWTSFL